MLQHLLNNVDHDFTHLKDPDNDWEKKGEIIKFSQADFLPKKTTQKTGMQEFGYVYLPNSCKSKQCNLHISLHGCKFGSLDLWIRYYDYARYAASNDLIMLFPMAEVCFDVQHETNEMYATSDGIQTKAIMKMVNRVASKK